MCSLLFPRMQVTPCTYPKKACKELPLLQVLPPQARDELAISRHLLLGNILKGLVVTHCRPVSAQPACVHSCGTAYQQH
jgi:hypothetical protein